MICLPIKADSPRLRLGVTAGEFESSWEETEIDLL